MGAEKSFNTGLAATKKEGSGTPSKGTVLP